MIDVKALAEGTDPEARAATVAALGDTLERSGFCYLVGHDVPPATIDALWDMAKAFHTLPMEAKQAIALNEYHRGYIPFSASTLVTSSVATVTRPNQSESLMVMHELSPNDPDLGRPLQGPNQWPDELPQFREVALAYMARLTSLGEMMAGGLAEALGLPREWFLPYFSTPTLFLRLLHYPRQEDDAGLFGAAPHTDYGFITLLIQDDVGGLEVCNKHGDWIAAPPVPGAYVMNVGDILQRWSNGRFASTPHRVRNLKPQDRYSMPFFFDPGMDALVSCPPALVKEGEKPPKPPVVYGDYLLERLNKNYAYRRKAAE
ncbi:isopenicillin N synthase family dioxygenase [Sphingomonas bacterium]|uniref:isopenicillin N synthase family dioxygenase n=1 Tax=Sphingomonas bacterium TaxID=1895847 RepID=UPI001C2D399A|nr:2OG-Fe(II) oxygenase family protein [Sphingomonas bacterium]